MDDDADLPGYDAARAAALVDALAAGAAYGVRPAASAALDPVGRGRELRRLIAARGELPASTLAAAWRELEGARLATAGALRLVLWGGREPEATAAHARRRFGAAAPLALARAPEQALEAAAAPGVVAVLPLETAWWGRLLARPALRVFAAAWPELRPGGPPLALAVAAVDALDATGDDRSFWVTDAPGSAERVEAQLGAAGFAADLAAEASGLRLWALAGFVQAEDARLADAPGRLTGIVGAAPGPLA